MRLLLLYVLIPTPIYIYEQVCSSYEDIYRSSSYEATTAVCPHTYSYIYSHKASPPCYTPFAGRCSPLGVLLQESHMSLHTYSYISVVILLCVKTTIRRWKKVMAVGCSPSLQPGWCVSPNTATRTIRPPKKSCALCALDVLHLSGSKI